MVGWNYATKRYEWYRDQIEQAYREGRITKDEARDMLWEVAKDQMIQSGFTAAEALAIAKGAGQAIGKPLTQSALPATGAQVRPLTQAEQRAISKIDNIIRDHLQPSDVSGAVRDAVGNPVPKPGGGYWDHTREVNEAISGLRNHMQTLGHATDPVALAARQRAMDAIKQVDNATKGLGI